MSFDRRSFVRAATGALAFTSGDGLLLHSGIAQTSPIRIANIHDLNRPWFELPR